MDAIPFEVLLGVVAIGLVLREALTADRTTPDADHATPEERAEAVRVKQLRLAQQMKREGRSLLNGRAYRPALTKPADAPAPKFASRVVVPIARGKRR